jgi:hypothetical protein
MAYIRARNESYPSCGPCRSAAAWLGQPERLPGTYSRLGEPPAPLPDLTIDDFDFNRDDLKQKHRAQICELFGQIVDSWKPASTRPAVGVRAVGHTDEVGSDDYNWKLGTRRAEKVLGLLTGLILCADLDMYQRMTWSRESQGKKQRKPGVPANKNRRVEIFIQWGRVKPPPPPPPPRVRTA